MKQRLSAFWFNALRQMLVLLALLLVLVSLGADALNSTEIAMPGVQDVRTARLIGAAGTEQVYLPHILQQKDFKPSGSTVHYRLSVNLSKAPDRPLSVLVPKMALSGSLTVNSVIVGRCGAYRDSDARLEDLRCLHQPQLFVVPAPLWHVGANTLDITVYATDRQVNGLSAIYVGAGQYLLHNFAYQHWLRSDVPIGLAWTSLVLGLLSLGLGLMLWRNSVYLWFGLTSLANAVATTNSFVIHPVVPIEVFNWLAFCARLISVPLLLTTVLAFFGRSYVWMSRICIVFAILAPLTIWLSNNDRTLAIGLYVPWLIVGFVILAVAQVWGIRSRDFSARLVAALATVLVLSGLFDWLKASGFANFETVFVVPYTFGVALLVMGVALVMMIAATLGASVRRTTVLERELSERVAYEVTRNIPIGTFSVMRPSGASRSYFLFVSERFAELTSMQQAGGKDIDVLRPLIHSEDRDRWDDQFAAAFLRRESIALSFRMIVPHALRWVTVEARPRFLVDGSVIWDGVLVDETEKVVANAAAERHRVALQESRIAKSRLREREELLRDMHDGFGSQLAGLGMLARRGNLSAEQMSLQLDEIAADLYLMVDTMGHTDLRLEQALADMRYRLTRRLGPSADRLAWRVDLDALPELEARRVLQILRIMQEALHNALKHANAMKIEIGATFDPAAGCLTAWVRDNGLGLPDELRAGRGLNNIRQRAREIGASLHLANAAQGAEVVLELPLTAPLFDTKK